ncbi:sugar ABC transporter substrate-binding protein [Nocardioides sp. NPDC092400]|uniref:sugar ABC transporter substrate-binding protein n=1 Tax=Nocardioides sp. NPDC092400 TaxID=3155196 RepID=UPI0034175FC4
MLKSLRITAGGLSVLALLALSACSEETGGSSGPAVDTADYQAIAEQAMEPVTEFTGPADGPTAQPNKKVVFLACGFEAEGCNLPGKAAAAAGEALGWDVKVVDGKFDPRIYSRTVQEAIDDGADGIILDAVSAQSIAGPIKAARDAGLVVGSYDSMNEVGPSGVSYDVQADIDAQGEAMAAYMIWKSEGEANAFILNSPEFNAPYAWTEKAAEDIKACSSCSIVDEQDFTAGDAATRLPQLTVTATRQHPEMNVMIASYDAAMLASIPSMAQAGALEKVKVGTFNGVSPALELIRNDQLTASVGGAMEWGAWAAMDNMNRMLAGEDAVEQNVPIRLITAENIDTIEPGGPWTGDIDYAAAYEKIWNGQ